MSLNRGINNKKWKTKTFTINSLTTNNSELIHNADFTLNVISVGDLTVRFVRVIKINSSFQYLILLNNINKILKLNKSNFS